MGSGRWLVGVLAVSAVLLGGGLLAGAGAAAGAVPPSARPQACGWQVVPGANVPGENNTLYNMAVIGANDIWAVGGHSAPQAAVAPLLQHWNGSAWSSVPSPPAGGTAATLQSASGVAGNDVWAVGNYTTSGGYKRGLIMHWDGMAWAVVPSTTNPGTVLMDVAAFAANDVWATGWTDPGPGSVVYTTALHWDGTAWSMVATPNRPNRDNYLEGMTAVGPTDIWAVGRVNSGYRMYETLILHWNGTAWGIVSSPNPSTWENYLYAVSAVAANDVWAVGQFVNANEVRQSLTLHWNGSSWQNVPNGGSATLGGVAARAANDVWAVGSSAQGPSVDHWDGQSWQQVAAPPTPNGAGWLSDVRAVAGVLWTVGAASNGSLYDVFTARLAEVLCTPTPTPTRTATPSCTPGWQQFTTPNVGSVANHLRGIASRSETDGWAVGEATVDSHTQTLIVHWDGTTWSVVPSPDVAGVDNSLRAVVAPAANDAWAVGSSGDQALLLHWDGTLWSRDFGPPLAASYVALHGLAAPAANDVWAVGSVVPTTTGTLTPLLLHWNGLTWAQVAAPALPGGAGWLYSVTARTATDAWAVGGRAGIVTLTLHWDGSTWTWVDSPNVSGYMNYLYGVAAAGANDAWAVGEYTPGGGGHRTLTLHWNGTNWGQVASPNGAQPWNVLSAVTASGGDVWALGYSGWASGTSEPLALRWTGSVWQDSGGPRVSTGYNHLFGAVAGPEGLPWAVGDYSGSRDYQTLVVRYHDPCRPPITFTPTPPPAPTATRTPPASLFTATPPSVPTATMPPSVPTFTPTPSSVPPLTATPPSTPTFTATPPSAPTATLPPPSPTVPAGQFQDVPPENPFYFFIECMSTRGVISGYSCGGPGEPCGPGTKPYYRPGASLTRGQLAKIVSTAAGLPDLIPSAQQTFTDVPPASPFWLWIERMALHGVISGYGDGTFRPNNLVTRGQFAKIISNAAQWQDPAPAQPTFADVPGSDPFFVFVERVAAHGAISGYGCNPANTNLCTGQAEACPGTYFRPCALATRGQAAKIVTNAFFPNCVGAGP